MTSAFIFTGGPWTGSDLPPTSIDNRLPTPAGVGGFRDFGIDDIEDQGIFEFPVEEGLQNFGGIAGRAAAGVVGMVGEEDRIPPRGFAGFESRRHGHDRLLPAFAVFPNPVRQLLGRHLGKGLIFVRRQRSRWLPFREHRPKEIRWRP